MYTDHIFFIRSSVDRHLGCSHVIMATENNAMNWGCRYLFEIVISFPSDIHLEVGLPDHTVVLFLTFWGTSILFSNVPALPPTMHKGFLFSTASLTLVISYLYDNSHTNRCEMMSHCGFNLHILDD